MQTEAEVRMDGQHISLCHKQMPQLAGDLTFMRQRLFEEWYHCSGGEQFVSQSLMNIYE